jgi:flagellar basal-body rod modification protein FlgD
MVSAVTSSTSTTSTTSSSSSTSSALSSYDSFLKLFMAELQNQDPTSPMDTTQQMSQLASFSQVEQQVKLNTNLSTLISQNKMSQASDLIGKTVTDSDGNTGTVASVKLTDSDMTATLTDGKTMTLGSGITISNTSTSSSGS